MKTEEKYYLTFELNNNSKKYDKSVIVKDICRTLMLSNKRLTKGTGKSFKSLKDLQLFVESLDVFLPFRELQKGGFYLKEKEFYIPGYGFIEFTPQINYNALEDSNSHVNVLLKDIDNNEFEMVPLSTIEFERRKMKDFFKGQFKVGQLVEVIDGDYANMLGRVVGFIPKENLYKVIIVSRSQHWRIKLGPNQLGIRDEDLISTDSM